MLRHAAAAAIRVYANHVMYRQSVPTQSVNVDGQLDFAAQPAHSFEGTGSRHRFETLADGRCNALACRHRGAFQQAGSITVTFLGIFHTVRRYQY